jgi:DNA transposition AAA+ family ATPase
MVTETRSENEREMIITGVEAHLATGYSKVRLSNEARVDLATMDKIIRREGNQFSHNIAKRMDDGIARLEAWLVDQEAAALSGADSRADMPTSKAIGAAIDMAINDPVIVSITGVQGIGKSDEAKARARERPMSFHRPGVLRIEFNSTENRLSPALSRIADELGTVRPGYTGRNLLDAIGSSLRPGDTLILDEYNHLEGRAVNVARDIHQRFGIGVVMMGNQDFADLVWGKKDNYAALANRALHFHFPQTTEEDVDAWLNWKGLYGKALRNAAAKIGARPGRNGGIRTLDLLFAQIEKTNECRIAAGESPWEVTGELLLKVAAQTGRL